MVEAVVSLAIEKLADLLIHEAGFLSGVKGDVETLQAELRRMRCFLEDADLKHEQDARVTNWINEIRALAYDTEDIIDDFVLRSHAFDRKIGMRGLILRLSCLLSKGVFLRKVAKQIKSIRVKIRDISAAMQTYGIKFSGEEEYQSSNRKRMLRQLRRTYAHDEDRVIVSMEASTRNVMNELMKEDVKFRVVSIVGMGGLGKTTLARKTYNHVDVKRHFDCCSWIFASQQFSMKDVLQGIFKEVTHREQGGMNEEELVVTLHNVLKEKKYLIVLDDIWRTDVWDLLKRAFPNGRKGSKVLLTTRDKKVALYADPYSSPVELPLLTNDEGWELLQATAFPRGYTDDRGHLTELEDVGKEIVKKCGGLPLAIAVIGGLLATKTSIDEWKAVKRNISIQLKKQQQQRYDGVYSVLALSYQELPFHLKPCFLYLSQFPENFEINKRRLIWMWIAEGFISLQQNLGDDETIEDVGEQYIEELINRCMVQVSQRDHTGRGVKTLRIHDLIRDVCALKAAEDNFVEVIEHHRDEDNTIHSSPRAMHSSAVAKPRRIAVHSRMPLRKGGEYAQTFNSYIPLLEGDSRLRSLLYFVEGLDDYIFAPNKATLVFKKFRLLRVLNLGEVCLTQKIPMEIGNLLHLRYLGLGDVRLHDNHCRLPQSIANLKNLLTLELQSGFRIERNALCKLKSLRYLITSVDCRVDTLKQLETLIGIKAKNLLKNDAIFKLTKLRRLGATFEMNEEVEVVMRSPIFSSGGCLRYLQMWMRNEQCSFPNLKQLSDCRHLTKLHLNGTISYHHTLQFLPPSISKLILEGSRLKQDPMVILEKLPNLRYLSLCDAYEGSKMVCSAYGFPRLEELTLRGSKQLEEWIIEKNTMPCLRTLEIAFAGNMTSIPDGLKFIASLQQLILVDLRKEVTDGIQVETEKVGHIPTIIIL